MNRRSLTGLTVLTLFALSCLVHSGFLGSSRAQQTRMVANGSAIFKSVFASSMDFSSDASRYFAHSTTNQTVALSERHPSSTAYFAHLVTNDVLGVNWAFFAAPGIPNAPGAWSQQNPESLNTFTPANNVWAVVADQGANAPAENPFMFSRNLTIAHTRPAQDLIARMDGPPFAKTALILVRCSGAAMVLQAPQLQWDLFHAKDPGFPVLNP